MDLLAKLPKIVSGSQDDQAREIYAKLTRARCHGHLYTWYTPPPGVKLNCKIKHVLQQKGLKVFEQKVFDLTWVRGQPVRGTEYRKYFIGAPGKN